MTRALNSTDMCENILKDNTVCGKPAFSLSVEHDDIVFCRACFEGWKTVKNVLITQKMIAGLTPGERKALSEAIGGGH